MKRRASAATEHRLIIAPAIHAKQFTRKVVAEVVELRDLMPTLLEVADAPVPRTVDGRSVIPLMRGAVSDWRCYIHGEHCMCYGVEQEMQYVTDGRRKLIWLPRVDQMQFFDLEEDPGECHNMIAYPNRQAEVTLWRNRLIDELASRNCGWVRNGDLMSPPPEGPLVLPYKNVRWRG